jgi:hypothetical protein
LEDQVKVEKMDRACRTSGGEQEFILVISGETGRKETTRKTQVNAEY